MRKNLFYIIVLIFILTSCFKEDDPMPAFPMQTTTIEMGKYYLYQVYFDLASNEKVLVQEKNDYDLAFECGDSSWHIQLNTAAFMFAGNTGMKDFEMVNDTTGLDWQFDKSDGDPDSTAIGQWLTFNVNDTVYSNHVYVLNRGYDHLGKVRGLKKIKFTKVDSTVYLFEYSDMNNENYNAFEIRKMPGVSYTYFSFNDGGKQLEMEPFTDTWDLLFTQYTTLLFTNDGIPYPYLVTGVLSNYGHVEMAMDSLTSYEDIDLNIALSKSFSKAKDFMGYDWKDVQGDVNSGNVYYEIVAGRNYLIRTQEGLYFKLRFINFYSDEGEKGFPTFQYDVL
ncbi:MAG: hypothetical protein KQI35_06025 [Bacteroidetes bacterium]|nr:hypothetical protein [Bacteroidota bacterium]